MKNLKCPKCNSENLILKYFPQIIIPIKNIKDTDDFSSKEVLKCKNTKIDDENSIRTTIICSDCGEIIEDSHNLDEFSIDKLIDTLEERLEFMTEVNNTLTSKKGHEMFRIDTLEEKDYKEYNLNKLITEVRSQLNELENTNSNIIDNQFDESVHKAI